MGWTSVPNPDDYGNFEQGWSEGTLPWETGTAPISLIHGLEASLKLLIEVGVPSIHAYLETLTDHLCERLRSLDYDRRQPATVRRKVSNRLHPSQEGALANGTLRSSQETKNCNCPTRRPAAHFTSFLQFFRRNRRAAKGPAFKEAGHSAVNNFQAPAWLKSRPIRRASEYRALAKLRRIEPVRSQNLCAISGNCPMELFLRKSLCGITQGCRFGFWRTAKEKLEQEG